EPIPPISVFTNEASENIPGKTLTLVKNLLSKNFLLNGEIINPSDIGILVRQGWQGETIKAELTGAGIKAVTINDAKIFQSREAKAVNYLLQAFDNPSIGNINRALLSEFTSLQTK